MAEASGSSSRHAIEEAAEAEMREAVAALIADGAILETPGPSVPATELAALLRETGCAQ